MGNGNSADPDFHGKTSMSSLKMAAQSYRKVVSSTLTTNFREACQIVHAQIPKLGDGEVLIKNRLAGL